MKPRPLRYYWRSLLELMAKGQFNWLADQFKVCLVRPTYKFEPASHQTLAFISRHEVRADGYPTGGAVLTGKTCEWDKAAGALLLKAADTEVTPGADLLDEDSPGGAVVYREHVGGEAPVAYLDFGRPVSVYGGPFTVRWPKAVLELRVDLSEKGV